MKEALFYKKLNNNAVQCQLCPHFCFIEEDKRGKCGVRENVSGKLISLVYEKLCSIAVDPIEKKPLFHFKPGSKCLSIATVGCNLSCSFCQNWGISQPQNKEIFGEQISAEKVVELALEKNLPGIAYTYTEPLIAIEFYLEIMKFAKKEGLYNVWVSNGFSNPEPVKKVSSYLDAVNIDLKGNTKFYSELCGVPTEKPIQEALKIYKEQGVWIEITNLLIPGFNDKPEQIKQLVSWIKENLGYEIPLHFSRFFPTYKMAQLPETDISKLERAKKISESAGLEFVFLGNVHGKENSFCPECKSLLIERAGYSAETKGLDKKGNCAKCGYETGIVI
ncbi:MAG: AmmeMemoRadiSam system radical SAM enzyme [Candidatus ainarchaeum sp.]|nr:AmmeMemoRadiSam system radical SAM enzyme [Candidatus ainarchaeum sp.]